MKKLLIYFGFAALVLLATINVNGQVIRTVAGTNTQGYSGDNGLSLAASLGTVSGITTDQAGNIYISDCYNHTVRKITTDLVITTVAGINGISGYSGNGGPATNATLFSPYGLAFDRIGNLYIADSGNSVIRKVDTSGVISTVCGVGGAIGWGFSGDGGPAVEALINGCKYIAFDNHNNMYFSDGYKRVRKVDRFGIITTVAGSSVFGYAGDGEQANGAALASPQGIAVDTFGCLYISDAANNVIRKVSASGIISTIAGNNVSGYNGDNILATTAQINNPQGIYVDVHGAIFFADKGNNRIRKINGNNAISTISGNGSNTYTGDGNNPIVASLNAPTDLTINTKGNLLLADAGNFVVREVVFQNSYVTVIAPTTICAGTPVNFTLNTNNNYYGTYYQWTVNGVNVGSGLTAYTSSTLNNGDVVKCIIKDSYAGFTLDNGIIAPMVINPNVTPTISIASLTGTTYCQGNTATFTSTFTDGGTDPLIQWDVNGNATTTGENFSYVPANEDIVTCYLISNAACQTIPFASSSNINLFVNADVTPAITIIASTGAFIPAEQSGIIFSASIVNGGSTPTFQWTINGANIYGATNAVYVAGALSYGDNVSCTLTSNLQCATTPVVTSNSLVASPGITAQVNPFNHGSITIAPNPNKGVFTLKGQLPVGLDETLNFKVTDMLGNTVYENSVATHNGNIKQDFNLQDNLASGLYLLVVQTNNYRSSLQLLITK